MKGRHLGELEEIVLLTVASITGEAYGISIQEFLKNNAGRIVTIGSLHSTITRLVEKGYLDSREGGATSERGGRRKRLYTVTDSGREALVQVKSLRDQLWQLSIQNLS